MHTGDGCWMGVIQVEALSTSPARRPSSFAVQPSAAACRGHFLPQACRKPQTVFRIDITPAPCYAGKNWSRPLYLLAGMIDKSSPIPRYYQIAEMLKEQIAAGELAEGARLPSEREMSEQLGVSRMTVRQALTYLQHDGLIEVHQGVGAFVASPKQTYDVFQLLGFSEEMAQRGDRVESVVLEQGKVQVSAHVAQQLALNRGELALKVMRLRKVNAEPVLLESSYVPAALCAGIEHCDFATSSLYTLLEQQYGIQLQRAEQTLECVAANEYEQALFGISAGTAMLLLEGVTYARHDLPVEYFKAIYRGDRCKFHLESWRKHNGTATAGAQRVSVIVG